MQKFLVAAAMLTLAPAAQAVTFVNGSFEAGAGLSARQAVAADTGSSIFGWWVGAGGVQAVGSLWAASDGDYSLDLSGPGGGHIVQTLTGLTIGKTYRIGFDLSGNPDGGKASRHLTVSASSGTPETFIYTMSAGNSATNMLWQHFTYTFRATSTMQDVQLLSQNRDGFGPVIDNLTISAIPEPAAWGMMMAGFGLLGLIARRRRPDIRAA